MEKDSKFWLCMIVNVIAMILLAFLKPFVHLLPSIVMNLIIRVEMFMQIGLGFYGLWLSIHKELFSFTAKIYGILYVIYLLLKITALSSLNEYYIVVPAMFTPLPFVVAWLVDKSFYRKDENESEIVNN